MLPTRILPIPTLLLLLCSLQTTVSHMIEVKSNTKECFFEDLHVNDKVHPQDVFVYQSANANVQMTVTYQVGGGGHLDIDFWVNWPAFLLSNLFLRCSYPVSRPTQPCPRQAFQTIHRLSIHHCRTRRSIRILFLKSHESCRRQNSQVC